MEPTTDLPSSCPHTYARQRSTSDWEISRKKQWPLPEPCILLKHVPEEDERRVNDLDHSPTTGAQHAGVSPTHGILFAKQRLSDCALQQLCGRTGQSAPPSGSPLTQRFHDSGTAGSSKGLGCVTDNSIIACTYGDGPLCASGEPIDTLVIYSSTGSILYRSDCTFDSTAQGSVPIITSGGDVFMSDDKIIARVSKDPVTHLYPSPGAFSWCRDFTWNTPVPCGTSGTGTNTRLVRQPGPSVSPKLLSNGTMIVFATQAPGYVFAFYADNGDFIARQQVTDICGGGTTPPTCLFETRNTPAASYTGTNRFYVSMNAYNNFGSLMYVDGYGLLVAFEVNVTSVPNTIDVRWKFSFNGPSGASPAVRPVSGTTNSTIYFDGFGNNDPKLYKVTDTGPTVPAAADWVTATGDFVSRIPTSVVIDPTRNCAWDYALTTSQIKCVDLTSGAISTTYSLDSTDFVAGGAPASAMTLTHTAAGADVLIVGTRKVGSTPGHVTGIKLEQDPLKTYYGTLYFDTQLPIGAEFAPTQFPVLTNAATGLQQVAFPSTKSRLYLYGN